MCFGLVVGGLEVVLGWFEGEIIKKILEKTRGTPCLPRATVKKPSGDVL